MRGGVLTRDRHLFRPPPLCGLLAVVRRVGVHRASESVLVECEWALGDGAGFSNEWEMSATVQLAEKSWSRCAAGPWNLAHLSRKRRRRPRYPRDGTLDGDGT